MQAMTYWKQNVERRTALALLTATFFGRDALGVVKAAARSYVIHLPSHLVRFSLPTEMAREVPEDLVPDYFDPAEPGVFQKGFHSLANALHDFNGAMWVGALGSLSFDLLAIERSPEFQGDISNAEGLEKYIRWWVPLVGKGVASFFGRIELNGVQAVVRRFGDWEEMISFPIQNDMFVEFHLGIDTVSGTAHGSWVRRAESMRDAIRASIVVGPNKHGVG
jgi:hypothetical protein